MFRFDLFCGIFYLLSDFFLFPIFYSLILLEHGGFGSSEGNFIAFFVPNVLDRVKSWTVLDHENRQYDNR